MLQGMGLGRYWLGAPLSARARASYRQQLVERYVEEYVLLNGLPLEIIDNAQHGENLQAKRREAEAFAYDRTFALVDRSLERVTDKSAGLLQVVALTAAILTITVQESAVRQIGAGAKLPEMSVPNGLAILDLGIVSFLLLTNMLMAWYSDRNTYRDPLGNIDRLLQLAAWRSCRLTIALYGTIALIALTGYALLTEFPLSQWNNVINFFLSIGTPFWQSVTDALATLK